MAAAQPTSITRTTTIMADSPTIPVSLKRVTASSGSRGIGRPATPGLMGGPSTKDQSAV